MEAPYITTAKLHKEQAGRAMQCMQDTAKLAMSTPDPSAFAEGLELMQATRDRMVTMQTKMVSDWIEWVGYAQSIEGADTIPKFADRTGNIALQAQSLVVSQMTQWSELIDNVGVNYAFWVNQKVNRR